MSRTKRPNLLVLAAVLLAVGVLFAPARGLAEEIDAEPLAIEAAEETAVELEAPAEAPVEAPAEEEEAPEAAGATSIANADFISVESTTFNGTEQKPASG